MSLPEPANDPANDPADAPENAPRRAPVPAAETPPPGDRPAAPAGPAALPPPRRPRFAWFARLRFWGRTTLIVIAVFVLGYPLLAWLGHAVNDDPAFAGPGQLEPNQSRTVAMMAALIRRETDDTGWVPNNPIWSPSGLLLDDMPNFQIGLVIALQRFSAELRDQIGRTRGSSQIDDDLQKAAGFLQTQPDLWYWNPGYSLLPTTPSEQVYRNAANHLDSYNRRLAAGQAVFDVRADNMIAALERIAQGIGDASAKTEDHLNTRAGFPWDNAVDDLFYQTKGQAYGYFVILRALGQDFAPLLKERQAEKVYAQMLATFQEAAEMQPWAGIMNGASDSQIWPSHLAAQGFYLLRARTQLREVTDILTK